MSGTPTERHTASNTESSSSSSSSSNNNNQEWWLPSFPRWKYGSWTEIFTSGPRNDLIGILADKVVEAVEKNLDHEGPIVQKLLDDHLPVDKESIRTKLPFYGSTVEALKYQRDSYLLGTKNASNENQQQQKSRDQEEEKAKQRFPHSALRFGGVGGNTSASSSPWMPHDATAQGYVQIVNLGAWFVPSETIKAALLPIALSLPSGALRDTINTTVSNAIPLAQPPLDAAMKNAVMGVIQDPRTRQMIKSRTQKILRIEDDDIHEEGEGRRSPADG